MKIKSFVCPKSIRNYEKKNLGTSDTWLTSHLSHWPSEPAYYIVDCWFLWPDVSDFVQKLVDTVWTSNDVNCPETLRDPQGVFGKMR